MVIDNNNLGPLTPLRNPRKGAKKVLAGIVAAAGIAGGTAVFVASAGAQDVIAKPRMAGMPPVRKIQTTQPTTAPVTAVEMKVAGGMPAVRVAPTTQPTTEPTTKPEASTTTQPAAEVKAIQVPTGGLVAADRIIVKPAGAHDGTGEVGVIFSRAHTGKSPRARRTSIRYVQTSC